MALLLIHAVENGPGAMVAVAPPPAANAGLALVAKAHWFDSARAPAAARRIPAASAIRFSCFCIGVVLVRMRRERLIAGLLRGSNSDRAGSSHRGPPGRCRR